MVALWLARNKDGNLFLFTHKPELAGSDMFVQSSGYAMEVSSYEHPEVTFENSPRVVTLKLCNDRFPVGSKYYYVTDCGAVSCHIDHYDKIDDTLFKSGNYFYSESQAKHSKIYKAFNND